MPAIGDTAEYDVGGEASSLQASGQKKVSIEQSTNHGRSVPPFITRTFDVREDSMQSVGNRSKSRTVITWLGADAEGNVYLLGESLDGTSWDVVSDSTPPLYMPSKIRSGSSWKYSIRLASGNTESATYDCVGTESVSTPAGDFQALKLSTSFARTGIGGVNVSYGGYAAFSAARQKDMKLARERFAV